MGLARAGTRDVPDIRPIDVAELLDRGAEVVIRSKGVLELLQIRPETLALLEQKGIPAHVLPTGRPSACTTSSQRRRRSGACSTRSFEAVPLRVPEL